MTKQLSISQQIEVGEPHRKLTAPKLFLSSEGVGWQDLLVRAYHEPSELEGWREPVVPETILVLLTQGSMLMQVNGSTNALHIRQNDFFLKPGGCPTKELSWKSLSAEPMQTLQVHLNTTLLTRTAEEITNKDPASLSLLRRSAFQDPLLMQIGLSLWRELEQPTSTGNLYAQTAAQMLIVHLLRHYASVTVNITERQSGLTRQQVNQVTEFIQVYLTKNLSLEELAQQVGFSPYHFARLFRQATGESPHQFVLRLRIERVQWLLKKTDMPLTQVALESGFANQSHLTQVFKRYLGLTPKVYRQNY